MELQEEGTPKQQNSEASQFCTFVFLFFYIKNYSHYKIKTVCIKRIIFYFIEKILYKIVMTLKLMKFLSQRLSKTFWKLFFS